MSIAEITADVRPGADVALVNKRLDALLADLMAKGPSADEVQRVATRAVSGRIAGLESVGGFGGKAVALAEGALYLNDPAHYRKELADYARATPASVRAALQKWLSRPVFALTVEPGERPAYEEATQVEPPAAPEQAEAVDPAKLPPVGSFSNLTFPAIERARLSNGIQVFLRDLPAAWPSYVRPGVVGTYFESEWALVSVLQGEGFWRNVSLPAGTKYVLSITWSDVDKPGRLFHRPASACTPDEILAECLAQCGVDSSHLLGWKLDRELARLSEDEYERLADELPPHLALPPARGKRMVNFSPLTILEPGARRRSPGIGTDVPNLFLAGEAIYSPDLTIFVPTMEKAANSGYQAAHQIVDQVASPAASDLEIDFRDPVPFAVLRRVDRWLWNRRSRPTAVPTAAAPQARASAESPTPTQVSRLHLVDATTPEVSPRS